MDSALLLLIAELQAAKTKAISRADILEAEVKRLTTALEGEEGAK